MQPLPTPVRVPLDLERELEHEYEGGGVRGEEQDQKILDQKKHNQEVVSMVCMMRRKTHPAEKKTMQRTKLDTLMANEAGFPRS